MAAVGFDVYRFQLATYVIAGMLGGLSGFLLANASEFVSPAYMSWQRSGELIVMVLLGGLGSLNGAIIGTAAYLLTEEWLSGFTEHWKVIFGPVLVLVVLFARGGPHRRRNRGAEARPWLKPCCASRGLRKKFGALVVDRRPHFRRHAERAACHHWTEWRRQDNADQSDFRLATPDAGSICLPAATSRPCRCTRAQDWAWRERSRSARSFPDSRRSRTSRSRCRRAPARASVSSATPQWSRH
jgi:hypothetical protein